ncbi:MAG: TetR/AcrR family transcriptional regulator [Parvularculaceae bacterium]
MKIAAADDADQTNETKSGDGRRRGRPPADARGITAADGSTKARIERAAVSLFVERGVDAATTREIAAAAGVAEGTLYRHFKSKDEIAESAFFSVHNRLADMIEEAGEAAEGVDDQARAIVASLTAFADADWTLFRYHLLYTHHFVPRRHDPRNPVSAAEALVARGMARGDAPAGDARLVAAMALGVVLQAALHKAYGILAEPMAAYRERLERGVVAVLRAGGGLGAERGDEPGEGSGAAAGSSSA